jgi:hypothetical protein
MEEGSSTGDFESRKGGISSYRVERASLLIDAPVGEPGGGLVYQDFEGWTKWLSFPLLGDSMVGASGRVPLSGNLENKVFEGYTKCPAVGPPTI